MRSLRAELGLAIIGFGQWLLEVGGRVGGIQVNIDRTDHRG